MTVLRGKIIATKQEASFPVQDRAQLNYFKINQVHLIGRVKAKAETKESQIVNKKIGLLGVCTKKSNSQSNHSQTISLKILLNI